MIVSVNRCVSDIERLSFVIDLHFDYSKKDKRIITAANCIPAHIGLLNVNTTLQTINNPKIIIIKFMIHKIMI